MTKYQRCPQCSKWVHCYQGKRFCNRSCASLYQHAHKPGRPVKRMKPAGSELRVTFGSSLGRTA